MASIYDYYDGDSITQGLQGCDVCNEAIQAARRIAAERRRPVVLEDDDGVWRVDPNGSATSLEDTEGDEEDAAEIEAAYAEGGND